MPLARRQQGRDSGAQAVRNERIGNEIEQEIAESAGGFPHKRIVIRMAVVLATVLFCRSYLGEHDVEYVIARSTEHHARIRYSIPCSKDFDEDKLSFPDCTPTKCGRIVMDNVVSVKEANVLLSAAKKGLALGGSNGGASILDLHSGALSKGDAFVDIYRLFEDENETVFTEEDFSVYRSVKDKIHTAISKEFGVDKQHLYLTKPTFFSRMDTKPAQTVHDQYWHAHVDKETYGSFHYTSLLYLTTYKKDFTGGRFIFIDKAQNSTVEPKLGRVSFFTSGSENLHHVEKVYSGTRYAVTISFTCDPERAISDPELPGKN